MAHKQMYRDEVYALLIPENRPHLRFGQAVMVAYPDYFKGPNSQIFYTTDNEVVVGFLEKFFEDNQIPFSASAKFDIE